MAAPLISISFGISASQTTQLLAAGNYVIENFDLSIHRADNSNAGVPGTTATFSLQSTTLGTFWQIAHRSYDYGYNAPNRFIPKIFKTPLILPRGDAVSIYTSIGVGSFSTLAFTINLYGQVLP